MSLSVETKKMFIKNLSKQIENNNVIVKFVADSFADSGTVKKIRIEENYFVLYYGILGSIDGVKFYYADSFFIKSEICLVNIRRLISGKLEVFEKIKKIEPTICRKSVEIVGNQIQKNRHRFKLVCYSDGSIYPELSDSSVYDFNDFSNEWQNLIKLVFKDANGDIAIQTIDTDTFDKVEDILINNKSGRVDLEDGAELFIF